MKKTLIYLLIMSMVFLGGCSSKEAKKSSGKEVAVNTEQNKETQPENPTQTEADTAQTPQTDATEVPQEIPAAEIPVAEETPTSEETTSLIPTMSDRDFCAMMQTNVRPLAVMIDNDNKAARPQIGLESAYMIYEVIVEGGASRLMAIFKDNTGIGKVGPIRSSRHYFLDFALEHDAIYCHAGWSPRAQSDIRSLGVNNINGVYNNDYSIFYRDNTYDSTWHNLYTGVNTVYKHASGKRGYRSTTKKYHTTYNPTSKDIVGGSSAVDITLPYSSIYKVSYKYDAANKVYVRYVNGEKHMSQTGNALTAKNIIVYQLKNYTLNDGENKGRQDINTVGSGSGKYITNGKSMDIKWSKSSRKSKTMYTDTSGKEIVLNPGITYIQIIPATSTITIK